MEAQISPAVALGIMGVFFVLLGSGWIYLWHQFDKRSSLLDKAKVDGAAAILKNRSEVIGAAKGSWVVMIDFICIFCFVAAVCIALSTDTRGSLTGVCLRLAAAPAPAFALWFCAHHYSKERKLEEEYAYRSRTWQVIQDINNLYDKLPLRIQESEATTAALADVVAAATRETLLSPVQSVFGGTPKDRSKILNKQVEEAAKEVKSIAVKRLSKE